MEYKTLKMKPKEEDSKIIQIHEKQLIQIDQDFGEPSLTKDCSLEVVYGGELNGHAIFLPWRWDWVIAKDSTDKLCLVPLRKEEASELGAEEQK